MSTPMLVQAAVIALAVGWSALFAARRLLPVTAQRVQAKIAGVLDRPSWPLPVRRIARSLQPIRTIGRSCASGCTACSGCAAATAGPADADTRPLALRRQPRS